MDFQSSDAIIAIYSMPQHTYRFSNHASIASINESIYIIEGVNTLIREGFVPASLRIFGLVSPHALELIEIITWQKVAEELSLWGNEWFNEGQYWLAAFRQKLDDEDVWRETVAPFAE